jgi:isopenicillin-N N-acyltransferase-like protein
MPESPFPVISLQGGPYERGKRYGSLCSMFIQDVIAFYRRIFEVKSNLSWDQSLAKAKEFVPFIRDYDSEIMEEMEGIAAGAGRPLEEVVALNVRSELLFLLAARKEALKPCCTSVAVLPPAAQQGQILLAQNWDWYAQVRDRCVILRITQAGRPDIFQVVEAGLIAKVGMNSVGIGLCTNALVSDDWRVGVPYHAILRKILNAGSMTEAIGAVTKPLRASSGNYLIGHEQGEAIGIEAAPGDLNFIFPEKGVITHTNHYKVLNPRIQDRIPALWPDSIVRDYRAGKVLTEGRGKIGIRKLQQVLTDHFDKPYSVCTHPDSAHPDEEPGQTNFSIIMNLPAKKIYLAKGPPCEHGYVKMDFRGEKLVRAED